MYNRGMCCPVASCAPDRRLGPASRHVRRLTASRQPLAAVVIAMATAGALVPAVVTGPCLAQVVLPPDLGVGGGGPRPSPSYDLSLAALAEGRFDVALELATTEYRTANRTGTQRWIDSIAAAAVMAECHYELGNLAAAVAATDEALLLSTVHANWLLSVQFGATGPRPLDRPRAATWGKSRRTASPARVPDAVAIRLGTADPQEVLKRGGVLAAPSDRIIRPQEIARGLVTALYRHGDILGDLARDSAPLDAAARALARRAAPPNHYSQSWIDVAWGTALWAQGKAEQARPLLERGLVLEGSFDHPLAAWALIVLGRIALDAGQPAEAARLFEEATFTAADFGDARSLEEAFRWAFAAHMAAGTRGVPASIARGADWAAQTGPPVAVLASRMRAWQAECLAINGDARTADAALAQVDGRLLRAEPGRGSLGTDVGYARAMLAYTSGAADKGDAELDAAIALARPRSARLFQTMRLVERVRAGAADLSDRRANESFARLLGPPSTRDRAIDPLGTLTVLSTPRADAFQTWIGIAVRRGDEAAIDATEAAACERWQSMQFIGGRRLAVDRLLDASVADLSADLAAQRAAILGARPDLAAAIERMGQLRGTLAAAERAAAAQPAAGNAVGSAADWAAFGDLARLRGRHVAALAAGRDGVGLDFPPVLATAEVRRRLAPRQLILSFHWTAGGLAGVLEARDRAATWEVRQAADLAREIELLARGIGLFDPSAPVSTDKLIAGDWSGSAARIERILFENARVSLADGIDELVIVPDGWLWYVPFELLPVSTGGDPAAPARRLRDVCRIRYCPTRSLAVTGGGRPRGNGPVGIHAGRMLRGDKPATAATLVAEMVKTIDRAVPLSLAAATPPPALVADTCEAIALFEEVAADRPAATRLLVPGTSGQAGMTFGDWLAPPLKQPRVVILPGLQTAMSGGFDPKRLPARPGDELFAVATDLIAAGAPTVLLTRWRVGGRTSADLVAEFLRDATATVAEDDAAPPASESWHRAVDVVTADWPDPQREPRLKQHPDAVIGPGSHPFLWSGFLLVDCGSEAPTPEPPPPALRAAAAPAGQQAAPNPAPAANAPAAPNAPAGGRGAGPAPQAAPVRAAP